MLQGCCDMEGIGYKRPCKKPEKKHVFDHSRDWWSIVGTADIGRVRQYRADQEDRDCTEYLEQKYPGIPGPVLSMGKECTGKGKTYQHPGKNE